MVVLIWYAWETSKLRKSAQKQVKETQRQIEIQQRPFVIVRNIENDMIEVENVGSGTAINVKICCIQVDDSKFMRRKFFGENDDTPYMRKIIVYQ